ncbi:hypothetical protein D3C77_645870 [compost metagenome]
MFDEPGQLLTVHDRHHDICQYDMRAQRLDQLQRFLAVRCLADDLKAVLLPVQYMLDALPHQYFIIHNEYSVQFAIPHF